MSPEEYGWLVDGVTRQAADEFRRAAGGLEEQRRACCRYFKRGHAADFSHPELIDFLGVSTPSVLDMAGYSDEDALRVMDMLSDISDDELARVET